MELELATTEELIAELINRRTFVGLIMYSLDERKFTDQVHEKFKLVSTTGESTLQMLETAIETVKGD